MNVAVETQARRLAMPVFLAPLIVGLAIWVAAFHGLLYPTLNGVPVALLTACALGLASAPL